MAEVELPNAQELEELREKSFPKKVALVTAVFAVILAIASLGGNNATKEMLLSQQESSNRWAFYQAKATREHLYGTQNALLEANLLERGGGMKPEVRGRFEAMLRKMKADEARYGAEKKEIEREARKLERERDLYRSKVPYFEYAEVLLQIAIVMASVSILASSLPVFSFAVVFAFFGTMLTLNGFLLIYRIPFLH